MSTAIDKVIEEMDCAKQPSVEEKIAKRSSDIIEEIKRSQSYPITSNDDPQFILSCLRMLGTKFCMQPATPYNWRSGKQEPGPEGSFEIRFNANYIDSLIKDVGVAEKEAIEKKNIYFHSGSSDNLHYEFEEARAKCDGLIRHLRLQLQDKRKAQEEQIRFEEDIKTSYRRY